MTTALITHPDCLAHLNPPGHPERVERLVAIHAALEAEAFAGLVRLEAPLATEDAIVRAHPARHLAALAARAPATGFAAIDADTFLTPGIARRRAPRRRARSSGRSTWSWRARSRNAFCAVRPPGHHAETATAMGFCYFGNAVIGARHALEAHGLERVAIVDFDVHHGNGTQELVWNDPRILFASTHQMPLYPGTGAARRARRARPDRQRAAAAGRRRRRVPRRHARAGCCRRSRRIAPELILISAGFDAHARDPLANLQLAEADFAWVTERLCDAGRPGLRRPDRLDSRRRI